MLSARCKDKIGVISLLNIAEKVLSSGEIQNPKAEAEIILASLLNCSRNDLYLYREEIPSLIVERFQGFLKKRLEGEPLQYIFGSVEFCGLKFKLDKGIFIPRPETELLVEAVLKWLGDMGWELRAVKILDIGTGCGNIAISIAKRMTYAEIVAVDISKEAILIAKENARLNGVFDRIEFLIWDLYEPIQEENIKFDCIVSNPPYIASSEIESLQKEILHEPRIALDGGLDGLECIRRIIQSSPKFLKNRSCIFLEIGYNQAKKVERILREDDFEDIYFVKDYSGIERIVVARYRGTTQN